MIKRLICLIKGHRWGFWIMCAPNGDVVQYEKCLRCPKFKDDGEEQLNEWLEGE